MWVAIDFRERIRVAILKRLRTTGVDGYYIMISIRSVRVCTTRPARLPLLNSYRFVFVLFQLLPLCALITNRDRDRFARSCQTPVTSVQI